MEINDIGIGEIFMTYRIGRPGEGAHAGSYVLGDAGERVSWGAIIAGVFAALAVQVLFALVGLAVGFVADGAADDAAPWFFAFAGLASLFCGGFVAGRLAGVPLLPAAALHGALVWSVVTVLSVVMAVGGAATVAGGAARFAASIGQAAVNAAGGVAGLLPDDLSELVPDEVEQQLRDAMGDQDLTARDIRKEAREIFTAVIGENERSRAADIVRETARKVLANPQNASDELSSALDRLVGAGGVIGEEDRQELVAEMSARFDMSEEEATAIVERWGASLEETAQSAQTSLENARAEVMRLVEQASDAAAKAAGWAAFALFIGLFGACAGALVARPEDLLAVEVAEARAEDA